MVLNNRKGQLIVKEAAKLTFQLDHSRKSWCTEVSHTAELNLELHNAKISHAEEVKLLSLEHTKEVGKLKSQLDHSRKSWCTKVSHIAELKSAELSGKVSAIQNKERIKALAKTGHALALQRRNHGETGSCGSFKFDGWYGMPIAPPLGDRPSIHQGVSPCSLIGEYIQRIGCPETISFFNRKAEY